MDPLVTVDELEYYLQRAGLDANAAALAVAGASGIVRDFCRWHIAPAEDVTLTLDGSGTHLLTLPTLYLNVVTEVRVDDVVIDPSEYRWSQRGQLSRTVGWPAGMANVEIDCVHGYAVTPDAPRAVTFVLAARMMANPEGLKAKTVGGVSRQFGDDLSELQMAQMAGFRLP
jgi:hypothetical protein